MDSFEEQFTESFETATLAGDLVTLEGLRELSIEESETLFQQIRESGDFLREHLPWVAETSPEDLRKRARSWVLADRLGQGGCWKIFENSEKSSDDGRTIDSVAGFIMMDVNLRNHSATLSYWLLRSYTGRGLMTQSLELLCRFCFDVLKLNRLEILASSVNIRSRALAARCGFIEEGVCRDFELKNGFFVDHVRFSRLARD